MDKVFILMDMSFGGTFSSEPYINGVYSTQESAEAAKLAKGSGWIIEHKILDLIKEN